MYQNPFNENMTYPEALTVLFTLGDQVTDPQEREQIKADYAAIIPAITTRELSVGADVLTSYPIDIPTVSFECRK